MRKEKRIVRVARIDHRVVPFDWAFARDEAARIDAHWAEQRRQKPALFDGRVLLAHHLSVEGDCLHGACFETGFKSFLSWRDFGFPGAPVANCFAMAALRSADGAFMLGEMSSSTANAGRLYFPSGTPEPADADADGRVDLDANTLRELEEETGLRPDEVAMEVGWTIVFDGPAVGCMKRVQSSATASELQARLATFNATQDDPELISLVPVKSAADYDSDRLPACVVSYLASVWNVET